MGTQDPIEFIGATPVDFLLVIARFAGAARFLHLETSRGRLAFSTQGSTRGHNSPPSANAFGVAATPAPAEFGGPYPDPFNSSNTVETFSSDGPRRFFFNADGTAITPGNFSSTGGQLIQQPLITAADGVSCAAPGFNPFFGTSAAAPHAGAIAALVKSADLTLTATQISTILTSSTIDIEAAGVDRDSGFGILDAFTAVAAAAPTPTPTHTATRTPTPTVTPTVTQTPTQTPTATITPPPTNTPTPGPPPTLASMNPNSGPAAGGTASAITGTNLVSGATVTVGGTAATGVSVPMSTQVNATMPARPAGTLNDVVVTNPGGASATLVKGWLADFADVPQAHGFHDRIEDLFRSGVTSGCGGGNFCPAQNVTRAQMAVFLLKGIHGAAFVPPPATGTVFNDVNVGDFAAANIEQLAAEGITSGCGGGNYCPNASVTREQMAVFLLRSKHGAGYVPPPATGDFDDVPISSPFAKWIEQLAAEGITAGCGGNNYCPSQAVTRGQMAVFLVKTFDLP
jgi:hypothetical protein